MSVVIIEACITARYESEYQTEYNVLFHHIRTPVTSSSFLFYKLFSYGIQTICFTKESILKNQINYSSNSITRPWNCRCSRNQNNRAHVQTIFCCMHLYASPARSHKQFLKNVCPLWLQMQVILGFCIWVKKVDKMTSVPLMHTPLGQMTHSFVRKNNSNINIY